MMTPPYQGQCSDCCDLVIALRGVMGTARAQGFETFNSLGPDRYLTYTSGLVSSESAAVEWEAYPGACSSSGYSFSMSFSGSNTFKAKSNLTDRELCGLEREIDPDPRELFLPYGCYDDEGNPTPKFTKTYNANDGQVINITGSDPGPPSHVCEFAGDHIAGLKTQAGNITLTPMSTPSWTSSFNGDDDVGVICTFRVTPGGSGVDTLSNSDSYDSVKTRLASARASGHAYRNTGITSGNILTFTDGDYPALKYYNSQHGSYRSFWYTWRNKCNGDAGGEGTVGFTLDPRVFDHGLDMKTNAYFDNPNNPYEQLVSYAKRFENEVGEFEGVFSVYDNRSQPPASTLKFDRVRIPLWGKLQLVTSCYSPQGQTGTTYSTSHDLVVSEQLNDPIDQNGSLNFSHSSWGYIGVKERQWASDIPDVTDAAFVLSSFCLRNKALLWYPSECTVTVEKITLNYKDGFDTSDGSNKPLVEQLASAPVVQSVEVEVTTPFNGGFCSSELVGVVTNNCQKIVLRPVSIALNANGAGSLSSLKILSKQRKGNFGFPQLDHMKDSIVWVNGKVFKGLRKNTAWYRKLTWTYAKTISSASTDSCPALLCQVKTGEAADFSTTITIEKTADPSVIYDGWTSATMQRIFSQHWWSFVSAESSQGETSINAPTYGHHEHPPVWGSVGYDEATATTAYRGSEWSDATVNIASLTPSSIPIRALYGKEREEQDLESNYFLNVGDGCGPGNSPCASPNADICLKEPYSEYNHRAGGNTIDPYYGYSSTSRANAVAVAVEQTVELTVSEQGFYGIELPEILDEQGNGTGTYDTSQLLPGERADGNGRVYSPIVRSATIYAASAPPSGHYDVIRNIRIT